MLERMTTFEKDLATIWQRVLALETWEINEHVPEHDTDEELVPGFQATSQPVSPARVQRPPVQPRVDQDSGNEQDASVTTLEDACLRWKDVSSIRMPALPESAGALRTWKNAFPPTLIALEGHLYQWLMVAFNAKTPAEIQHLRHESEGFPRFDRVLCSWFTRDSCLKGHFGIRIQAHLEMMSNGISLRGRPLLHLVIREFDLDSALGSVVSSVELFQLQAPESDLQSLVAFRDKVQFIMGQLPINERPGDNLLAKFLYERLKKVRPLQLTIDRIRESKTGSVERTYDYLWTRLQRVITESQHEKNLASIQEGLKKGPKKFGLPGGPSPDQPLTKMGGKGKGGSPSGDAQKGKSKGKGKGGKNQAKSKGNSQNSDSRKQDEKGKSNEKSGHPTSSKEGVCIFFPKGLCRRGADCPYKHQGSPSSGSTGSATAPKAKATSAATAAPKAQPSKAAMVAMVVLGTAAGVSSTHVPESRNFEVEWALDSGAGEDLASLRAFCNQGVPEDWVKGFETVSNVPLTFETGGGPKAATNTIGVSGDKVGEGLTYMLKSCPYVKSLGKLVEKGFSFFWGPSHAPTLVPPEVPFEVYCDSSLCHQADRVDHCVPVFKERISFTHGMPAVHSHDILEESLPAPCAEAPPVDDVFEGHVSPEPMIAMSDESALAHPFSEGPHGNELRESKDSNVRPSQPEILSEEPKALARQPKIPVDHLLTHQPAHPACDVCRQAKLRAHAHRRFKNQAEAQRIAQAIEAPKAFLQAIAIDHLESTEEGSNGELYALICVDLYSGALFAYPASSKSQTAVERALVHFARGEKPIVHTDRYSSLLAALKHLNFPIELLNLQYQTMYCLTHPLKREFESLGRALAPFCYRVGCQFLHGHEQCRHLPFSMIAPLLRTWNAGGSVNCPTKWFKN